MMKRQPQDEGEDGGRSVPERLGAYLYYTRHDEGKGFPLYVRRLVEGTVNDEQVVGFQTATFVDWRGGGGGAHEGSRWKICLLCKRFALCILTNVIQVHLVSFLCFFGIYICSTVYIL